MVMSAPTNATARNVLRVAGIVVLAAGLTIFILCGKDLIHVMTAPDDLNSPDFGDDSVPIGAMLGTGGGFLMIGIGLQLLNLGFLRAQVRYLAEEASPAVATLAGAVHEGLGGANGPFCSACGTRNDAAAHFCDSCGKPLTVA